MPRRLRLLLLGIMLAPAIAHAEVRTRQAPASCPTLVGSLTAPVLFITANGACVDLTRAIAPGTGGTWTLNADPWVGGNHVQINAAYDGDPFITFGATTTNFIAGPVTYAFLFGTPITPGFYGNATSTAGVSVTNGAGGTTTVANSAIYPTFVSGYGTLGLAPTNLGVDLGTTPCVAGPGAPATVTQTCNYGTTSNNFAPAFYDNLEALLTYTQNDVGSVASWSGGVTLNPPSVVPEPATLSLMIVGVVGMVAAELRRRSRDV